MSIRSLTYKQNVFKSYHSDKRFSEFLPTRWRQKSTGIDMKQNYVTVTQCIYEHISNEDATLKCQFNTKMSRTNYSVRFTQVAAT